MKRIRLVVIAMLVRAVLISALPAAAAPTPEPKIPEWVRPAVRSLASAGYLDKENFRAKDPMTRTSFTALMEAAFDGGYSRTKGYVTAREVDAALVRALDRADLAAQLSEVRSPDGWDPKVGKTFGTEIVARELGLRRDRPITEEKYEASAGDQLTQADIVYSVSKALTSPNTYGADALASFELDDYGPAVRQVVKFAFEQVGRPYIWGGEWPTVTPASYPYGAQVHGGFDCSGFSWFVLRQKDTVWSPMKRPYEGWSLPERSSHEMAHATKEKLGYRKLSGGDLMFFGTEGRDSQAKDVYHAGIYLGGGWMIDSAGSQAGVSLSQVGPGSWWNGQFAWGRRVVTPRP